MALSEAQAGRHPFDRVWLPPPTPGFHCCRKTPSRRAVLTTPADGLSAPRLALHGSPCGFFPRPAAFPDLVSGRHPRFNFSRLARASLTLRPVDSLTHHTWAWSEGFDAARYQTTPLLSYTGIPGPPVMGLAPIGGLARSTRTLGSFGSLWFLGSQGFPGRASAGGRGEARNRPDAPKRIPPSFLDTTN